MATTADWEAVQAETAALYEEGRFAEALARTREGRSGPPSRAPRWPALGKVDTVLGQQEALVVEIRPFDLHGVNYSDVTVAFPDGSTETARLGPEAVPEGLRSGEQVLVTRAANQVISLARP